MYLHNNIIVNCTHRLDITDVTILCETRNAKQKKSYDCLNFEG